MVCMIKNVGVFFNIMSSENSVVLTEAQKERIQRNRAKAISLKAAKLVVNHPYAYNKRETTAIDGLPTTIKIQGTKYMDSGGGFLIEQPIAALHSNEKNESTLKPISENTIAIPVIYDECLECGNSFADSFLMTNFDYKVCDKCHDADGAHSLITRTEAKAEYLLKDCDLDKRQPPLRYISRKNPHNIQWGEMKLYLHLQVKERALSVWGNEDELQKQHENREEKREIVKIRKYNKKMKQLRMEMRSSLYTKKTDKTHAHEFDEDIYNEEDDTYTHSCKHCSYRETFEKM